MLSKSELEKLSKLSLDEIDKTKLKEVNDIIIDSTAPYYERMKYFFEEIQNPYCFLVDGMVVQIKYNNETNKTLNDCLYSYLSKKKDNNSLIL